MANILANVKKIFAANSPESGEYKANGLTNAIRHQSQWSQNDRQTFVGVCNHSRSFTANSSKIIRLSRIITEKPGLTNGYECLRISYESLRISYEAYDYLTISVANFL